MNNTISLTRLQQRTDLSLLKRNRRYFLLCESPWSQLSCGGVSRPPGSPHSAVLCLRGSRAGESTPPAFWPPLSTHSTRAGSPALPSLTAGGQEAGGNWPKDYFTPHKAVLRSRSWGKGGGGRTVVVTEFIFWINHYTYWGPASQEVACWWAEVNKFPLFALASMHSFAFLIKLSVSQHTWELAHLFFSPCSAEEGMRERLGEISTLCKTIPAKNNKHLLYKKIAERQKSKMPAWNHKQKKWKLLNVGKP